MVAINSNRAKMIEHYGDREPLVLIDETLNHHGKRIFAIAPVTYLYGERVEFWGKPKDSHSIFVTTMVLNFNRIQHT